MKSGIISKLRGVNNWIIALIVLMFSQQTTVAQSLDFSDSTVISLLTCEPGTELYARFGHTAIRVRDDYGRDVIFNYGLFDFSSENFYWKFILGQTDYQLGISPTDYFMREYQERGSTVWEQVLNLSPQERKQLVESLKVNYKPENRVYRYNFAYDNCATRPKEIIQNVLQGVFVPGSPTETETYRQLINRYLHQDPWAELGINLLFGASADKVVRKGGSNFLPLSLMDNFQRAKVVKPGSEDRLLVSKVNVLNFGNGTTAHQPFWLFHPLMLFIALMIPGVGFTFLKKGPQYSNIFDTVLFLVTGLAGVIIFVFTFFSEHPLVQQNFNLLWLNPLNLFAAILLWLPGGKKPVMIYLIFGVLLILAYFIIITLEIQSVPVYVVPLVALLLYRMFRRMRRLLHQLAVITHRGVKWQK